MAQRQQEEEEVVNNFPWTKRNLDLEWQSICNQSGESWLAQERAKSAKEAGNENC